jgi:hypothetical protein
MMAECIDCETASLAECINVLARTITEAPETFEPEFLDELGHACDAWLADIEQAEQARAWLAAAARPATAQPVAVHVHPTITVPRQPAPIVNVEPKVTVEQRPTVRRVERDAIGDIVAIHEEPQP